MQGNDDAVKMIENDERAYHLGFIDDNEEESEGDLSSYRR